MLAFFPLPLWELSVLPGLWAMPAARTRLKQFAIGAGAAFGLALTVAFLLPIGKVSAAPLLPFAIALIIGPPLSLALAQLPLPFGVVFAAPLAGLYWVLLLLATRLSLAEEPLLALAGILLALMPAFLASRGHPRAPFRDFYAQGGWLVAGALAAGVIFGSGDLLASLRMLPLCIPLLIWMHLRALTIDLVWGNPTSPGKRSTALTVLSASIVAVMVLLAIALPDASPQPARALEQRSAEQPLGTDYVGRGFLAQTVRIQGSVLVLSAASALVTAGGCWLLQRVDPPPVVSDVFRLAAPVPVAAAALGASPPLLIAVVVGLLLTTRAGDLTPAAGLRSGLFAAFQIWWLVILTEGALLAEYGAVSAVTGDARFLWQAAALTGVASVLGSALLTLGLDKAQLLG